MLIRYQHIFIILAFLFNEAAFSELSLETYNHGSETFQIPQDWVVEVTEQDGFELMLISQEPDQDTSAALLLMRGQGANRTLQDFVNSLIDELELLNVKVLDEEIQANSYKLLISGSDSNSVKGKYIFYAFETSTQLNILAFAAPLKGFEKLGGESLLFRVFEDYLAASNQETPQISNINSKTEQHWWFGVWETNFNGYTVRMTNRTDGSYTFEINTDPIYREQGTWQLNKDKLTQTWVDPRTGEAKEEVYDLIQLPNGVVNMSGGNLEGNIFDYKKVSDLTKPAPVASKSVPFVPIVRSEAVVTEPLTNKWFLGEWITRDIGIFLLENHSDGSYVLHAGNIIIKGAWKLSNDYLVLNWISPINNQKKQANYAIEQVSNNSFRVTGGDLGLQSLLYERYKPDEGLNPKLSWLLGSWWGFSSLDKWTFNFKPDGNYQLEISNVFSGDTLEQGTWWVEETGLHLSNYPDITFAYRTPDDLILYLTGSGLDDEFFQKVHDPSRTDISFAGQYIREHQTLTLRAKGNSYEGSLLIRDKSYPVTARAEGDQLVLLVHTADGVEQEVYRYARDKLVAEDLIGGMVAGDFEKVSETALPSVSEITWHWIKTEDIVQDDSIILLADGRYLETDYTKVTEVTKYETEGSYKIKKGLITFDPVCGKPFSRRLKQIENHMILSGDDFALTYMAAPPTNNQYMLDYLAARDKQIEQEVAQWEATISLAPAQVDLRIPPSDVVPIDPNPEEVYSDATAFAAMQLYPQAPTGNFYAYDIYGSFRTFTSAGIIFNNENQIIDYGKGEYHDEFRYYFFPNGRMFIYIETYFDAISITHPPTPNVKPIWGRYRIEGDTLYAETDLGEVITFDLLYGRRTIRYDETCYDNIKTVSGP